MNDRCFACEKDATSREHAPPMCIFPEEKDSCRVISNQKGYTRERLIVERQFDPRFTIKI